MKKRLHYLSIFALLAVTTFLPGCQKGMSTALSNTTNTANVNSTKNDDAPRIPLADAKADFDADTAFFVDTRAEAAYKQEHIKGAINVPREMLDAKIKELPKDKKIIVYCSWPNEHTSASLVSELKSKGFDNAYALLGGTQAWKTAGYPMEKSQWLIAAKRRKKTQN